MSAVYKNLQYASALKPQLSPIAWRQRKMCLISVVIISLVHREAPVLFLSSIYLFIAIFLAR